MRGTLIASLLITICSLMPAQWQQVSNGLTFATVYGLTAGNNYIYAGTSDDGVFISSNNGNDWTAKNNGMSGVFAWEISAINNFLFTGIFLGGTFRSSDNGENWTELTLGSNVVSAREFIPHNSYIFTQTWNNGVFRTLDNGENWEAVNNGLTPGGGWDMLSSGSYLFCCNGYGVFRSTNDGNSWTDVNNGLTSTIAYRMTQSGSYIYVGTYAGGIFRTSDYGDNWEPAGLSGSTIYALQTIGANIFAGTSNSGVYLSTDNGNNWADINEGLFNLGILSLAADDIYLYTGTTGTGVFRREIDNILSVQNISGKIPSGFSLEQNYPNPFNPSTVIGYQLPVNGNVTLKVYDILGNEVAVLVDEELPAGSYEVEFAARELSSGMYFYKLQAGNFVETKKMILMR